MFLLLANGGIVSRSTPMPFSISHFTCLPATVLFASPNPLPPVSRTPMPHAAMSKNDDRKLARCVELVPFPREDINCG